MKRAHGISLIFLGLGLILALIFTNALAGAPINDNFADRLQLEGSSVRLSGTVAGATLEPQEPTSLGTHSLWWSWKAPENGLALVHVIDVGETRDGRNVIVSTSTNLAAVNTAESTVATCHCRESVMPRFMRRRA
jgi:hypothetical protein